MRGLIVMGALLLPLGVAQAGDWVLGGHWGQAQGDSSTDELNAELQSRGLNAVASGTDDSRSAWKLLLGYEYTPQWGVEVGYANLGTVATTFTGTAVDIDAFLLSAADIHPQTAKGWQLGGKYRYRVSDWLHLQGRAGLFRWNSDYTLEGVSALREVSESGVDLTLGAGVELGLDRLSWMPPGVNVGLDWERYNIDGEPIDLWSLGLSYRFAY